MTAALFWLFALLFGYVYAGYPLLLWLATLARMPRAGTPGYQPRVSILIAAHNEQAWIHAKIRNALEVDYPADRLQVIVASDGSSDDTLALAQSVQDERLIVLDIRERGGKANALNQALAHADGDIVVFTDANVFFQPQAVARLAAHFADPACGCVSGRVDLQPMNDDDTGEPLGEGFYMRLERFLQARESRLDTLVGTDGALFAARRELVEPLPAGLILDDFLIATRIAAAGHAVRYEAAARAMERVPASVAQEFRRKVRIAAGCFQVLPQLGFLRRPWQRPRLWTLFVSHKLLRWLSPWLLAGLLVTSALLAGQALYAAALGLQLALYALAVIGWWCPGCRHWLPVYVPYYFAAVNLAFALGLWRQLTVGQPVTWERVDRDARSGTGT